MGRSKLDLELGGRTFLQRAIDAAAGATGIGRCLVVVRPEDESRVTSAGAGFTSPRSGANSELGARSSRAQVEVELNQQADQGQSASIRLATERLTADTQIEAVIFSVVDQPFLTPTIFESLIAAWTARHEAICVSSYAGQRGNPALFPRAYFEELIALRGDVGGREVMRRHPDAVHEVPMSDAVAGRDIDTWNEYELALADQGQPPPSR